MDRFRYKGSVGAAAVLLKDRKPPKTLRYYLGPLTRDTTFKAKAVTLNLGLKLLKNKELSKSTTIKIDSHGIIQSLAIYKQHQSYYSFNCSL